MTVGFLILGRARLGHRIEAEQVTLKTRDIKVALIRHKKTGKQVSAAVGLSPSAFSRLIHGHRRADPELLDRIEQAIRSKGTADDETAGASETPPAA